VSRAIVAAFVKGLSAASIGQAVASVGLAGLTVGIFIAFTMQRKYRQGKAAVLACLTA
jgi:hypothetical protein